MCPTCGPQLGYDTRQRLLPAAHVYRGPRLLTLTVDPKRFASPREALDHVREGQYIRKLLDRLGVTLWVWVLEFQRNGHPHWHVLIDAPGWIDYAKAHKLWRRWGCGEQLDFTRAKLANATHAVMYITKYLMKKPRDGYPSWVMGMERSPRMVGMSRTLSARVREDDVGDGVEGPPRRQRRSVATIAERVAACGEGSILLVDNGCGGFRFVGAVPVRPRELWECARRRHVRTGTDRVECDNGAGVFHRPWIERPPWVREPEFTEWITRRVGGRA